MVTEVSWNGLMELPTSCTAGVFAMKQSQQFLNNAENCAELAERAKDEPSYKRFKLMEAGWLALAREQDWLDGVTPPNRKAS
jgi:hypothetical protein